MSVLLDHPPTRPAPPEPPAVAVPASTLRWTVQANATPEPSPVFSTEGVELPAPGPLFAT
jgi:hypothetical protein